MDLTILTLDYETHYSDEYSLRRLNYAEYILDARWETIGASARLDKVSLPMPAPPAPPHTIQFDTKARWLDGPDLPRLFEKIDWKRTALMSHNIGFDGAILAWRYGIVPALYIDTLGMCRAMMPEAKGASLDKALTFIGAPPKGTALAQAKGMRLADIKRDPRYYREYTTYANRDADGCFWIFRYLAHGFAGTAGVGTIHANEEFLLMDMVARMAIVPQFSLDTHVLAQHLEKVQATKANLLRVLKDQAILDPDNPKADLMSNERYAEVLRKLGVVPPTKISLKTGKESYAFSKQDQEFMDLLDDEDPAVQAVVAARLGFKSTLEETRTERFIKIAGLRWPNESHRTVNPQLASPRLPNGEPVPNFPLFPPRMPFPLKFSGAHTHRFCLVGETTICCLREQRVVYGRLDALRDTDLVWDGEAFVAHGGLAYAGRKRVITHDGVTGTPDHRVWTVEHGYLPLEVAKARGQDIARGGVPDAARIDPSVHGTDSMGDESPLRLRQLRQGSAQSLGGPDRQGPCLVSLVRGCRADEGVGPVEGDAGCSRGAQPDRGAGSPCEACCATGTVAQRGAAAGDDARAGAPPFRAVGPARLGGSDADRLPCPPTLHEPKGEQLSILRRQGGAVRLSFDSTDGGLAVAESRPAPGGDDPRPDQHERALRAGEPALGDGERADGESELVETWDIVNCGPRSRFMANGRVVHNSGDWSLNLQNLGGDSALRRALIAPPGYKIVAPDASQIEARVVSWLAGCTKLVSAFENKEDVYSTFASSVYGYPVNKNDNPTERFLGKTAILGLGYGMGAPKFVATCWVQSKRKIRLEESFGQTVVKKYRSEFHEIPAYWKTMDGVIHALSNRQSMQVGVLIVDGPNQSIILPNGMRLYYKNIHREYLPVPGDPEKKREQWVFEYGRETKYTFGGKVTENVVQALSKIITMNAATRIRRRARLDGISHLAGQVHDQLIYVVREEIAQAFLNLVIAEMSARLDWFASLPLAAEGGVGDNLLEVK